MKLDEVISPAEALGLVEQGHMSKTLYQQVIERWPKLRPEFVNSTIQAESAGKPRAVSDAGAQGLMQVMPATGREVAQQLRDAGIAIPENADLNDPEINRAIGTEYLGRQLDKFGSEELASAAYNSGPKTVSDAIAEPGPDDPASVLPLLPAETQAYVPRVMNGFREAQPAAAPAAKSEPSAAPAAALQETSSPTAPYEIQKDAIAEGAAAGIRQAEAEAEVAKTQIAQNEQLVAQQAANEKERQSKLEAQQAKIETAVSDYANTKIEPGNFWKNKSTEDKIVSGIAIALSALGQGLQASAGVAAPNYALKIISDSIDRDIEAQKIAMQTKGDVVNAQRGIYADMRSRFNDEREAELAAQTVALNSAQLKLQSISAENKSATVQANAKLLYGQIEEKKQEKIQELQKSALASPVGQLSLRQQVLQGKVSPEVLTKDDRERYVEGLGFAPSAEEAKKMRESQVAFQDLEGTLSEIKKLREDYGAEVYNRTAIRKGKTLSALALLKIKNLEQLGALDKGAIEIGDRIIPEDPTEFGFGVGAGIDEALDRFRSNYQANIRSRITEGTPFAENPNKFHDRFTAGPSIVPQSNTQLRQDQSPSQTGGGQVESPATYKPIAAR